MNWIKWGILIIFHPFGKLFKENLAYDNWRNLMLVTVGMPNIVNEAGQNRSRSFVLRSFNPITLDRMPDNEAKMIIEISLEKGSPKKTISKLAMVRNFILR